MAIRRRKEVVRTSVPIEFIKDSRRIANQFGFKNTSSGIEIMHKLINNEVEIKPLNKRKGRRSFELRFYDL